MKLQFLIVLLLLVGFPTPTTAKLDLTGVCLVCKGLIAIPETDDEAQILMKLACDNIDNQLLAGVCRAFAAAIHKTNTWPELKWLLESIKEPACKVLCPKKE